MRISNTENSKIYQNKLVIILILLYIGFIASIPFIFYKQIFVQHDYIFHIARLEAYTDSIKTLDFFPKIFYQYGNGGGYGVDIFYPSIFLIPYALLRLAGCSIATALYLFYFILNFAIATTSYLLGKYLFKKTTSAIFVSILYTLSMYRFTDLVIRGALGEVFGFIFIPIALIGIHNILFGDKHYWYVLPIGMSLLLLSHLLSAIMLFIVILWFLLIQLVTKRDLIDSFKRWVLLGLSGVITILLTSWQIIPLFQQGNHMKFNYSKTALSIPGTPFKSALKESLFANFKASYFTVGTGLTLLLLGCLLLFFKINNKAKLGVILCFFMIYFTSSSFPWLLFQNTALKVIQFPFRFTLFTTLFIVLLTVYIWTNTLKSNIPIMTSISIGFLGLFLFTSLSFTPTYDHLTDSKKVFQSTVSFGGGQEYVKEGLSYDTVIPKHNKEIRSNDSTQLSRLKVNNKNNHLTIVGSPTKNIDIETPFLYYYGYVATDSNGKKLKCFERNGRVALTYPKNIKKVTIFYKKTSTQNITAIVSILSIVLFSYIIIMSNKQFKGRHYKNS